MDKKKQKMHIEFGDYGILYALVIFWIGLALTNQDFRALAFYQNILTRASLNAICGVGMTFVIISGDLDLSVASQVALNGVVLTLLLPILGIVPAILLVLALGIAMGVFNGVLIAKLRIPSFIATLGMQMAYRALAQLVNSSPVVVENSFFKKIATYKIMGLIPTAFLILIVVAVTGTIILRKTKLGRYVLAIGNSKDAARISGINVSRTQIMIYLLVGLFTACASVMIVSNLGSSNYGMQDGLEFTVISAVVLGGTALSGGKGSIFNTVVAAIFLVTIRSAMDSFGVSSYWQKIVEGVILVIAFSITEIRNIINNAMIKGKARKQPVSQ
ncbi:ABC transporter permease [uncultured Robinsoniella sp.]|uniref:ABC transporter permease n=1 Tax=uncultured Robinsoniella sp. TaxID=904190 RepID=UPI00374EC19A